MPPLSRRQILQWGAGAGTVLACSRSSRSSSSLAWPRTTEHAGVPFIELFPSDADESCPVVVGIHGRGDRPERWVDSWRTFPGRARIALPRAPMPFGDGFSWFEFRQAMTDGDFGAEVGRAEERLWRGIEGVADKGQRLFVTGFSQGGILSFAIASRRAERVIHAFPIAGSCPGPLLPKPGTPAAPISAFHGSDDDVLAIHWARESVKAWNERGGHAELREYPGVRHAISGAMRGELWDAIVSALGRSPAPGK